MTAVAQVVDKALRDAGIPILGVHVPNEADRATWTVEFAAGATDPQKAQAATILATIVLDNVTLIDSDVKARLDDKALKAVVCWVADRLAVPRATARTEVIAVYKSLP